MGSRTWFRIFSEPWLKGSIRQEPPEYRGLWVDLLALANSGMYGDEGEIKLAENIGFTDQQIAGILQVDLALWKSFKERMIQTQRISVQDGNVIIIEQWQKYQSEYRRQKNYREKLQSKVTTQSYNSKLQPKVTIESYNSKLQGEGEREGDKKEIRKRVISYRVIPSGIEERKKKEKNNKKERKKKEPCPPSTPQIAPQFEDSLSETPSLELTESYELNSKGAKIELPANYMPRKKDIDPSELPQEWHRTYFLLADNTVIKHPGRFVLSLIENGKEPKKAEKRLLEALSSGRKLDKRALEQIFFSEPTTRADPEIKTVFAFWQKVMKHPRATLDDRRKRHLKWALENYGLESCLKAIAGNKLSDFHQGRTPDNKQVYDQIDLIFRNAEKVEFFLRIWKREMEEQKPPQGFEHLGKEIQEIVNETKKN